MKIALAQINTTVGDFAGNLERVRESLARGRASGVDLVVFPELTLSGYPAEDLLERKDFLEAARAALEEAAAATREGPAAVVGVPLPGEAPLGKPVHNSAVLLEGGRVAGVQHKTLLPTYDVFDEARYFQPAAEHRVFEFRGLALGLAVCEDVWNDPEFWPRRLYALDPVEELAKRGARAICVLSASPFSVGRARFRLRMLQTTVRRHGVDIFFSNLVGGNSSLIFDGSSYVLDRRGELLARGKSFEEDFVVQDLERRESLVLEADDDVADAYRALVLGTRDYLRKSGFERVVLGLSGGIDSSLTAAIARDAAGAENTIGVSLPSRYSSEGSEKDARTLAERLGIRFHRVPIEEMFGASLSSLEPVFQGLPSDVTEENLQARIRGTLLMAISNKLRALLLTTGNKSELAVGYCTLYGDMCGGLAVISDVPKTLVYRLARYVNRRTEVIPRSSLEKPPSAELRPGQTDQDTLPAYEVLDPIVEAYVERGLSPAEIVAEGHQREVVDQVVGMIDAAEYKRKQSAPGLRITSRAFGPGRRFPLVERWRRAVRAEKRQ
jgi:NAD+ synthase (glutamine-hydrolysing)